MSDGYAQKDIDTVTISGGKNGKKTFYVKKTNGVITFCDDEDLNISASLLTTAKPTNLDSWKSLADIYFTSSTNTASAQSVYYITGDPKNNAETVYTITVSDSMLSTSANISSKAVKIGDINITKASDNSTDITTSGSYPQDNSSDTMAISITPPTTSTSKIEGTDVSAYTADATIVYTITRDDVAYASGSKTGGVTVNLAPGKYTITAYAQKSKLIDSDTTTVTNVIVTAGRVYVNQNYTGTTEYGTKEKPFKTLQPAASMVIGDCKPTTTTYEPAQINILSDITAPDSITHTDKGLMDLSLTGADSFYLTINGNSHTIDANKKNRIMYFSSIYLNVTIKDLTMKNGEVLSSAEDVYGGAIYSSSSPLTLDNCTIEICSATTKSGSAYGGAIYSIYRALTLTNCTISGCSAKSNDFYASGGAICGLITTLKDCKIENCRAIGGSDTNGGAFYNYNTLSLTDCTISNCSATSTGGVAFGGVIHCYLNANKRESTLKSCTITNCRANGKLKAYGGVIYTVNHNQSYGCDCVSTLTDCTISNCSTTATAGDACGGVIYNYLKVGTSSGNGNFTSTFTNCEISNCSAFGTTEAKGGVAYNYDEGSNEYSVTSYPGVKCSSDFTNCKINGCSATATSGDACGGVIYNYNVLTGKYIGVLSSTLTNTTITDCKAEETNLASGGAICNDNKSSVTMTGVIQ